MICNHLVPHINQTCQQEPLSLCSRCPPFSWMWCAKLLITHAYSSSVITWIFSVMAVFNAAMVQQLLWEIFSLRNSQRKEIWGFRSDLWGAHSTTDETLPKLFTQPSDDIISSMRRGTILLKLLFLIKVLMFKFSPELFKRRNLLPFCHCYHWITLIIFQENWFSSAMLRTFLNAGYIQWLWIMSLI